MAISQDHDHPRRIGFGHTGVAVYIFWNLFTFVGAVVGNALGDPRRWGLDGAAAAAFVALLWPRLRSRDAGATAALAVLVTVLVVPRAPAGIPVLVAALGPLGGGFWPRRTPRAGGAP